MTEKEIKSKYRRVVRYKRGVRYLFDFKKNKIVKDKWQLGVGYCCECGCKMYGNWDIYQVGKKFISFDHLIDGTYERNKNY